jgi:hypothetical protein
MFLCPFPKVFGFDSPNDLQYGLAGGKAGESTVKNFLEIVNLRFTIFTIYDFYECHYSRFGISSFSEKNKTDD